MELYLAPVEEFRTQLIAKLAELTKIWVVIRSDWEEVNDGGHDYPYHFGGFEDTIVGVFDSHIEADLFITEMYLGRYCHSDDCDECLSTVRVEVVEQEKIEHFLL